MSRLLKGKHIVLGVSGSIATYKAAILASRLSQSGTTVEIILTPAAQRFVRPLTFQSVTGKRAYTEDDLWGPEAHVLHIGLGKKADLLVIAPATANTLAKLAHGIADNLLTLTALATRQPLIVAPAMDGHMYHHPATQANIEILKERGVQIIGPVSGHLASGQQGVGRMVEPDEIFGFIRYRLSRGGPLAGVKVLVTAGGTREAIDPVRAISNRSSGKQGFALAQAALDAGADVTLIAGVTNLATPKGAIKVNVQTAEEMLTAVMDNLEHTEVLLMAAAVADFRPAVPAMQKIKKGSGLFAIELVRTADILKAVAAHRAKYSRPKIVVGFAAESQNLLANAQAKMKAKDLDMIAANDITAENAGFESDTNQVVLINRMGEQEFLPLMGKDAIAEMILERVQLMLKERQK